MFIRRLTEIFASDEVEFKGVHLPITKRNNPTVKTQILSSEEFGFGEAFKGANLPGTKLLLEGRGANVKHNLFDKF